MTEDEKFVERVARAIYESHPAYQGTARSARIEWDQARHGISGPECYRQARAALSVIREALREPRAAQVDAGARYLRGEGLSMDCYTVARTTYRAMIAASPIGEK